ncbi:MAG: hypothetical protein CM1200mP16_10490 [Nitrospina sp.]|nr:MAG: hypothetical protein CM1200mP16_10490 [Nitrospina sp.]
MDRDKNKNLFLISVIVFLVICILLYFSRRVAAPFFIAFALAYLMDPLVDKMVRKGFPEQGPVLFLMGAFFLLLVFACILFFPILRRRQKI